MTRRTIFAISFLAFSLHVLTCSLWWKGYFSLQSMPLTWFRNQDLAWVLVRFPVVELPLFNGGLLAFALGLNWQDRKDGYRVDRHSVPFVFWVVGCLMSLAVLALPRF